ncbi:hypothetical protein [Streptomyces thermolilacinus]|uniref:Heparin-binding hemagglutinin n=1 Tax=Streptomyces thermolilacinus SPC6 TaxID=1306406 RepID=A0A1D3DSE0_9ACTN|nr:hypothetical protein [Streptomyces thermolilacinus]OEJ95212.1 hypothetical protein J116_012670 [Streptomyces thermolilacinus SPC6]
MAIIDELRTPLYFAAGTADLAVQQARKIAAEAPSKLDAVRNTDPKVVQEKVAAQAKEAQTTLQAKLTELVGGLDTDLKKLGETAQGLALRGVGVATEYAVRARETYEKVAEHGEQTVKAWRGEAAEEITEIAIAVEPDPAPADKTTKADETDKTDKTTGPERTDEPAAREQADKADDTEAPSTTAAKATGAARKSAARRAAARKTAPSGTTDQK